ncbi:hypothetical protein BDW75DRAFT_205441 [Aspergillus navahoensis]
MLQFMGLTVLLLCAFQSRLDRPSSQGRDRLRQDRALCSECEDVRAQARDFWFPPAVIRVPCLTELSTFCLRLP